ncbi:MAG: hypothetical protein IJM76_02495 [Lachnospiraceae bacterium]|nr:hypothetical protein [Lachnospiraceae bacterium]
MKKAALFFLAFFLVILSSCGKTSMPKLSSYSDEYLPEQDFDPASYRSLVHSVTVLDDTIYMIAGNYLFYYDQETTQARPLCFKADCLHNSESDQQKRPECDAFIAPGTNPFLGIMNDRLVFTCLNQKTQQVDLVSSKKDGSGRKTLIQNIGTAEHSCIHRGVFFYVQERRSLDGQSEVSLLAYSLLRPGKEPYEILKYTDRSNISSLLPFGSRLFLSKSKNEGTESEEYELLQYDLKTGIISNVPIDSELISGAYENALIYQTDRNIYSEYNIHTGEITECAWLNRYIEKNHPNWWLIFKTIRRDVAFIDCLNENFELVYDQAVINGEGEEVCLLPGLAHNFLSSSEIIHFLGKDYYYSGGLMDPYTIQIYAIDDLLSGKVEPTVLLQVDNYSEDLTPAYILPWDGIIPE